MSPRQGGSSLCGLSGDRLLTPGQAGGMDRLTLSFSLSPSGRPCSEHSRDGQNKCFSREGEAGGARAVWGVAEWCCALWVPVRSWDPERVGRQKGTPRGDGGDLSALCHPRVPVDGGRASGARAAPGLSRETFIYPMSRPSSNVLCPGTLWGYERRREL